MLFKRDLFSTFDSHFQSINQEPFYPKSYFRDDFLEVLNYDKSDEMRKGLVRIKEEVLKEKQLVRKLELSLTHDLDYFSKVINEEEIKKAGYMMTCM